jgi:hypothetical protein
MLDGPCRHTGHNRTIGHILGHKAHCSHNGVLADCDAGHYDAMSAYPGILFDYYFAFLIVDC